MTDLGPIDMKGWMRDVLRRIRAVEARTPIARPQTTRTAQRPDPALMRPGTELYDTDIDAPVWVNAAGTGYTVGSDGGGTVDVNAVLAAFGVRPTLYYDGTSWPSRTTPAGYSGPVDWDSEGYTGVTGPTTAIDDDRWIGETV